MDYFSESQKNCRLTCFPSEKICNFAQINFSIMKRSIYITTLLVGMLFLGLPTCHAQESKTVRKRATEIFTNVYKQYAICNKNMDGPNPYSAIASLDVKYCSDDWNNTLRAVQKKVEKTDGIFFEADYWIEAQDFGDTKFRQILDVKPQKDGSYLVSLDFRLFEGDPQYNTSDTYQTIHVKLVKERGNWYIDDFLTDDSEEQNGEGSVTSWKQEMLDYLED